MQLECPAHICNSMGVCAAPLFAVVLGKHHCIKVRMCSRDCSEWARVALWRKAQTESARVFAPCRLQQMHAVLVNVRLLSWELRAHKRSLGHHSTVQRIMCVGTEHTSQHTPCCALSCRMDLAAARSGDAALVQRERGRFMRSLEPIMAHTGPKLLVTDSQVMVVGCGSHRSRTHLMHHVGFASALCCHGSEAKLLVTDSQVLEHGGHTCMFYRQSQHSYDKADG